jgi:hypothetical protein
MEAIVQTSEIIVPEIHFKALHFKHASHSILNFIIHESKKTALLIPH